VARRGSCCIRWCSLRCRHGRSRLYSTHTVVSLPPPSSVSSMLYDKSMLALDEGTDHTQLGVVRCGSCCTGRLSGAPPARPVRIVLARWFRCCRPIRLANALLLARVALGQRFGSRTAGLGTLCELLHPSVFGAMPSRPVQIGLTRWFRRCRPCPSYQCFMTCPCCVWTKVRVAYSGA
jgi:hypothetical protein